MIAMTLSRSALSPASPSDGVDSTSTRARARALPFVLGASSSVMRDVSAPLEGRARPPVPVVVGQGADREPDGAAPAPLPEPVTAVRAAAWLWLA